ncbi:MAG: hypothetical protein ACI8ZM_005001 [Crocinitomix sp.]|jgi:hypothetical protein
MSHTINIAKSNQDEYTATAKATGKASDKISFEYLERNRYGLMVVLILVVGCLGGIAVGLGALTQVFALSVLALTTMAALSMMLAVAPIKAIVYTSAIAVAADIIIILVNLIQ